MTRKQSLHWMESRLRRLLYKKTPTDRQIKRAVQLRIAIAQQEK